MDRGGRTITVPSENRVHAELSKKLEGFDIVSFDVFDTLLIRPYVRPTDLFRHMEVVEGRPGFADARILAERRARTQERPEPTLAEIYLEVPTKFADLMDIEMAYEMQALKANPGMLGVYRDALKNGKRVVLISDMYLPSSFVSEALERNGFVGHEMLYMSCEYGVSKHSGKLFLEVLEHLDIDPGEMVHVGDNKRSDVKSPERLGIATAFCERPIERYFRENPRERKFYKRNRGLDASILVSMDMMKWISGTSEDNYWYTLGYRYGGPVNAAFAKFIEDNTEDGKLLFIARDGYKPKLAYDRLYGTKETFYVYAPRTQSILLRKTGRDYPGLKEKTEGMQISPERVDGDGKECGTAVETKTREYGEYIKKIVGDDTAYVVDATTRKFTAQRLISETLGRELEGIYYTVLRNRGDRKPYAAFRDCFRARMSLTPVDFPEFLMASSEAPIDCVEKGRPMYGDVSEEEAVRTMVSGDVERGVMDFLDDMVECWGNFIPSLGPEVMGAWIAAFEKTQLPEDRTHMRNVMWSSDPLHSEYHGLIFSPKDAPSFVWAKIRGLYESLIARLRS